VDLTKSIDLTRAMRPLTSRVNTAREMEALDVVVRQSFGLAVGIDGFGIAA
jgi:hypothetical protein